jgi:hypothetical protein
VLEKSSRNDASCGLRGVSKLATSSRRHHRDARLGRSSGPVT